MVEGDKGEAREREPVTAGQSKCLLFCELF